MNFALRICTNFLPSALSQECFTPLPSPERFVFWSVQFPNIVQLSKKKQRRRETRRDSIRTHKVRITARSISNFRAKTFRYTRQVYAFQLLSLSFSFSDSFTVLSSFLLRTAILVVFHFSSFSRRIVRLQSLLSFPVLARWYVEGSKTKQTKRQIYNFAGRDAYNHRIPETVLFIISFGAFATSAAFSRASAVKVPGDYANPGKWYSLQRYDAEGRGSRREI